MQGAKLEQGAVLNVAAYQKAVVVVRFYHAYGLFILLKKNNIIIFKKVWGPYIFNVAAQ